MIRRLLAIATVLAAAVPASAVESYQAHVYAFTRASSAYGPGTADASLGGELIVPTLTVPEGGRLTFVNLAIAGHSIYSDAWLEEDELRLFNSEVVPFRGVSDVRGVSDLSPGVYGFFCSNHMGMRGQLRIVPTDARSRSR